MYLVGSSRDASLVPALGAAIEIQVFSLFLAARLSLLLLSFPLYQAPSFLVKAL